MLCCAVLSNSTEQHAFRVLCDRIRFHCRNQILSILLHHSELGMFVGLAQSYALVPWQLVNLARKLFVQKTQLQSN